MTDIGAEPIDFRVAEIIVTILMHVLGIDTTSSPGCGGRVWAGIGVELGRNGGGYKDVKNGLATPGTPLVWR